MPLCLILHVMVKCQLAASVRAVPALATEGYSLCGMCLAYNGISTQIATISSAVAGAAKLNQQAIVSVSTTIELPNERLELWEL